MLVGLLAMAALTGCDSTDPQGTGSLSVLLTDAAGDVSQAVVKIERVELMGGSGGPLVLNDTGWMGDLTELTNDFVTLVEETAVPSGNYSQLRLIISEACIGVETDAGPDEVHTSPGASFVECVGDEVGQLQLPSYAQTGIKVIFQGPIVVTSEQKIVLIDFDVAQSFGKQAGNSGRWVMDPTIKGVDMTFSGTVNVTVQLGQDVDLAPYTFEDFTVDLNGENQALSAAGTATFLFVVPDDYQVDLTPPAGWIFTSTPTVPVDVTVESQEIEDVEITLDSFGEDT